MMHSEFYNVALDQLRYSLVWEDSATLYKALTIQPNDRVLLITSAGCNVLNALLKGPRQVVAIDLNPVQNQLLSLKKHVIQRHEHTVFRALMGFDGPERVAQAVGQLQVTLPDHEQAYWGTFFASHPEGILTSGKLEAYITGFYDTLDATAQQKLRQLTEFSDVPAQWQFFTNELHDSPFKAQFIHYFDEANLSKGRAPELFTYAEESGGVAFYNRLCRQVSTVLVKRNFFFRFFFFGPRQLPESVLPPCYQAQHYTRLRETIDRLTVVNSEAVDYLLSAEGAPINKASLSNIFEYTNQPEFRRVCQLLLSRGGRPLRFVFWNLLQEQGADLAVNELNNAAVQDQPLQETACFYFRNVRLLDAKTPPNGPTPA